MCFFLFAFRTYAGIIRHSSFIDALKLLVSTFATFLALVTLNYIHFLITGNKIFLFPVLLIHFIISFLLLFLFRVAVKFLYEKYIEYGNLEKEQRVILFGNDSNAVAVANALNLEQPRKYRVVAFVDNGKSHDLRLLLGLPIVNYSQNIAAILEEFNAQALIITDRMLSKKQQIKIVDDCLDNDFKVLTLEKVKDWQDQKDLSKNLKNFDINDLLERKPIQLNTLQISNQLKEKIVLITGAAGSIGSEIVAQIITFNPHAIVLVDQAETPLYDLVNGIVNNVKHIKIIPYVADVKDVQMMDFIFKEHKPQVVYHAAAYKHVPLMENNPYQAVYTNVIGTKNTVDLAVKYAVESFVMISTDKAVNPSNIMGASKRIAEQYVQSLAFNINEHNTSKTKIITTRFGNVLGSNGSVVPLFTKQIQEGGPLTVTHPDIIRYFMTIPEACQLVLEAGSMGNGGEIYIFDMGKPVKIIDLAHKMIKLAGFIPNTEMEIKITGLRPGEKLYEELLNESSKTLKTHHDKIMISKELEEFNYEIVNSDIESLKTLLATFNTVEIVKKMKQMVPEFKSMNSSFEKLD
ncbi:polysaccharide biosynthesis protein [Flavobacterium sp. N2270]|uniref:polysaccharide biosynthesis protein n=1 Tax=Flavobacterium sp. N2270 TaxID=2986831 RepID=UPI0039B48F4D